MSDATLKEDPNILDIDLRDLEKTLDERPPDTHSFISSSSSRNYSIFDPNYDSDLESLEDESPYPEVRSAVANTDDPDMPASTLRAWVLGCIMAVVIPGMNQFFYMRFPSVAISQIVAQLIAFPLGRLWVRLLPDVRICGYELNPGPFSIKEHVLVTIMATVGATTAYATDIIAVQRVFYGQNWSFLYKWLLVMSTQLIGFSMGGIARRFLVAPPSMIWPNTLVTCALFNTLHAHHYAGIGERGGLNRERFFLYVFCGAAAYYFIPGYLFHALSVFTWVCWIAPNNVKINTVFGYRSGLGFSLLTFDWTQIAYQGSPLATPWWAEVNVMIGFFLFYWLITPILYFTNTWNSAYMPLTSIHAYDNTGHRYNHTRIMNDSKSLDPEAYENYSPLYLSTTFVLAYGVSFLAITSTISHAIVYFWKPIRIQMRRSLREQPDVHARLMSHYPQVPEWYYACLFVPTFTFACVCITVWDTKMPIWALVIALLLAITFTVPIGMIQAITNRQVGLNVITELIVGYMLPGRPNAMMIFKTYGYITMGQALQFTTDFKLGHYMKVPPRPMFWCQIIATIIAGTSQLGVQAWMFKSIPDICTTDQKDKFLCAGTNVFGTASVVWGLIGPARHFSSGQIYHALMFLFPVGAALPVLLWLVTKRYPRSILNYLNFPLIFTGVQYIPPSTSVNFVPWAIVGFIFQYVIRRRHFSWWTKYNYVLSAALDAGTAVGVILVYFCLQYPMGGQIGETTIQRWWGNLVYKNTRDWSMAPLKELAPGEIFGPTEWK